MNRNFVALLAASALASPVAAFAQDAVPAPDFAQEQGGLEEIIVTARSAPGAFTDDADLDLGDQWQAGRKLWPDQP